MNSPKFLKSLELKYLAIIILPLTAMFYSQIVNFTILAFGERVLLETRPVDPRDILRGDYVTLGYEISFIDEEMFKHAFGDVGEGRREIFVTLQKDEKGIGTVKSVSLKRPPGGLYLRGVIRDRWDGITYGIGVYYVPEGTGREIEDRIRGMGETQILVDVRVLRGRPVIKDLVEFRETVLEPVKPGESRVPWHDD